MLEPDPRMDRRRRHHRWPTRFGYRSRIASSDASGWHWWVPAVGGGPMGIVGPVSATGHRPIEGSGDDIDAPRPSAGVTVETGCRARRSRDPNPAPSIGAGREGYARRPAPGSTVSLHSTAPANGGRRQAPPARFRPANRVPGSASWRSASRLAHRRRPTGEVGSASGSPLPPNRIRVRRSGIGEVTVELAISTGPSSARRTMTTRIRLWESGSRLEPGPHMGITTPAVAAAPVFGPPRHPHHTTPHHTTLHHTTSRPNPPGAGDHRPRSAMAVDQPRVDHGPGRTARTPATPPATGRGPAGHCRP